MMKLNFKMLSSGLMSEKNIIFYIIFFTDKNKQSYRIYIIFRFVFS